jgi:hypothetical protein
MPGRRRRHRRKSRENPTLPDTQPPPPNVESPELPSGGPAVLPDQTLQARLDKGCRVAGFCLKRDMTGHDRPPSGDRFERRSRRRTTYYARPRVSTPRWRLPLRPSVPSGSLCVQRGPWEWGHSPPLTSRPTLADVRTAGPPSGSDLRPIRKEISMIRTSSSPKNGPPQPCYASFQARMACRPSIDCSLSQPYNRRVRSTDAGGPPHFSPSRLPAGGSAPSRCRRR